MGFYFVKHKISKMKQIRLNLNENLEPFPDSVLTNLKKELFKISSYPQLEDCNLLIRKIAQNFSLEKKNIILTNGGYHALEILIPLYLKKGDELCLPTPNFPFYEKFEKFNHIKIRKIQSEPSLKFDIKKIIKSLSKKTKAVYLSNPNNPTGFVFQEKELIKLIRFCFKKKILVIVDEAYYDFGGVSVKNQIEKYKNLFIIRTFSKTLSLAGLKIGYIISNKDNVKKIEEMRGPIYSLNNFSVIVASRLLSYKKLFEKRVKTILETKYFFENQLKKMGFKTYSSGANFCLVKVNDELLKILRKNKQISLFYFDNYPDVGFLTKNHVRVTIGSKEEIKQLLFLFKKYGGKIKV